VGFPEAQGCRVAEREVAKPMRAIDRSFHSSLDRGTPVSAALLPRWGGSRLGTNRAVACFPLGRCDSAKCAVLAEGWPYWFAPGTRACATRNA
jgi:hypothetical protein